MHLSQVLYGLPISPASPPEAGSVPGETLIYRQVPTLSDRNQVEVCTDSVLRCLRTKAMYLLARVGTGRA